MSILGRGWSFPPRFDADQRLVLCEDVPDIEESLRILFGTRRGERVMQHAYGTLLHQFVFEQATPQTLHELCSMLRLAIMYFEPRIEVEALEARVSPEDWARIEIDLSYRVRTTNTRHNMVYPLYLDQASHPVQAG
ncbi:GPW/gp25 family protein [Pelomonas sp. BJYL3]|uniref:GPW/gp25 family protein n=1 Tax=Pelomonas sp. BJYL3 TaxID=2976697 RepID=UPI0022B38324|nr:GPW/gp25 family protein [Pelomonas sp. BJYL3]